MLSTSMHHCILIAGGGICGVCACACALGNVAQEAFRLEHKVGFLEHKYYMIR